MMSSLAIFGWEIRMKKDEFYHEPVLLKECLEFLDLKGDGVYVDCTLGGGGHSFEILKRLGEKGRLFAFDRDPVAIAFASERLRDFESLVTFYPFPFSEIGEKLRPESLDGALYDLGMSSRQVDDPKRGFSFSADFSVDLRMNQSQGEDAQEFLRRVKLEDLALAFSKNSDLERSYKLAGALLEKVEQLGEDLMPQDFKEVVVSVYPHKTRELNGLLARVYQAIRMEINEELKEIEKSLNSVVKCLKKNGRLLVISYHSVEDRCVKNTMSSYEKACICPVKQPVCLCGANHKTIQKVLRKPLLPSFDEIEKNPRARSAKLRVYQKL